MVTEGDLPVDGEHTTQHTDGVLQSCVPETYIILLSNVTPINSIKKENKKRKENDGKCSYFG